MSLRSRATDIGPEGKAWPLSRVLSPRQPPDLPFQTPSCLSCFLEKYSWPCVEFPHSDSNVLAQTFQRHGIYSEQDDQACSLQTVEDMKMLVIQSCPILCDLMDCCPPGSSVHGILQARILEWVAIPSSRGSSRPRDWTQVSCTAGRFFTIWTTVVWSKWVWLQNSQKVSSSPPLNHPYGHSLRIGFHLTACKKVLLTTKRAWWPCSKDSGP